MLFGVGAERCPRENAILLPPGEARKFRHFTSVFQIHPRVRLRSSHPSADVRRGRTLLCRASLTRSGREGRRKRGVG